jgi:hypothetical protein
MRTVNVDTLVRIGQPPWQPVPGAEIVDVWDKYDFPICGIYRLGGNVIVFTVITTAGSRSLWAYVPVHAEEREAVTEARFDTEAEFDAWLQSLFAGHEAVFAAAEDFVITAKSDGILIPPERNGLLAAATRWYLARAAAPSPIQAEGFIVAGPPIADDAEWLLRAAQSALAGG